MTSIRSEDSPAYGVHNPDDLNSKFSSLHEDEIIARAIEILAGRLKNGPVLTSPDAVRSYLRLSLSQQPREVFAVLFLDNRHQVIEYEELFFGTIDGASVHPREVARRALELNSSAVILAHNHPSGVTEPSQADIRITQKLRDALSLFAIRTLDHIIVGHHGSTSLAERGLM